MILRDIIIWIYNPTRSKCWMSIVNLKRVKHIISAYVCSNIVIGLLRMRVVASNTCALKFNVNGATKDNKVPPALEVLHEGHILWWFLSGCLGSIPGYTMPPLSTCASSFSICVSHASSSCSCGLLSNLYELSFHLCRLLGSKPLF